MKLRIDFSDGSSRYVSIPEGLEVTATKLVKPRITFAPRPDQPELWNGLWVTDTKLFVEVVTSEEAYTLNSVGGRMIKCMIARQSGAIYIDRDLCCKLKQRQIGNETFVKGLEPLEWPILRMPR